MVSGRQLELLDVWDGVVGMGKDRSSTQVRLDVAIAPPTAAALERFIAAEGATLGEAIHLLIGYGDLVYRAARADELDVEIRCGDTAYEVVLSDQ